MRPWGWLVPSSPPRSHTHELLLPRCSGVGPGQALAAKGLGNGPKDRGRSCLVWDRDWHLVTSFTAIECGAWCEGTGHLLSGMAKIYRELWWQTLKEEVLEWK